MESRSAAHLEERVVSYAQNREDVILAGFFNDMKDGFYVDIGANDPIFDSVTKYFYNIGWRGINIEPIPALYERLVEDRPRDINLKVGIADKPGELKLRVYDNGDGLSTFLNSMKQGYAKKNTYATSKFHDQLVPVKTLKQVFDENNVKHINFMKVDIEGYEYNALIGNDWDRYRPEVICIEANHVEKDWRPLLKEHHYDIVFFDGLNEYYVAREANRRAELFSYINSLIGRPIISLRWNNRLEALQKEHANLKAQQASINAINQDLERTIDILNAHIFHQNRLRSLVKSLILKVDSIIMMRLDRLASKPHYYPSVRIGGDLLEDNNELLSALASADKRAFNGSPSIKTRVANLVGDVLRRIYAGLRRLAYRMAKTLYKLVKKMRR